MNINSIKFLFLCCIIASCKNEINLNTTDNLKPKFQNKGHQLVFTMVQKVGDFNKLANKKSVEYTYTYETPDNKIDISTEKYMFNGELSYGKYKQHDRTLAQLEGVIEQGYNGNEFWLKQNGKILYDKKYLKKVEFNRRTNYYWFAMMQKLLDPGVIYKFLGEKKINNQEYNIVKVTFNLDNNKPSDIYQLYINKETFLVDQFLFTVADFGIIETPNLMKVKYEEIDDILIPTVRLYKQSSWDAEINDKPWVKVTWTDIKFNTGIEKQYFNKEN